MASSVVRLFAVCADDPEWPIVIDLVLVDGRLKDLPFFGTYGKVMRENSPFVLQKNGQVDFGHEWGSERYWKCNLRTKTIGLGETFTLDAAGEQIVYKISQLNSLSEATTG